MSRRPHFPGAYRQSVPCGMYPHEKRSGQAYTANRRFGRGISPPAGSGCALLLMRSYPGPDAAVAAPPTRPVFCSVPAADAAGPLGTVPFYTVFAACAELLFRNSEQRPASGAVRTADWFGPTTLLAFFVLVLLAPTGPHHSFSPLRFYVPSRVERILCDHPFRRFTVPTSPRRPLRLFSPIFGGASGAPPVWNDPFRAEKKKPDTGRYRASLVRLVRLMRVGNPTFCNTKVNSFLLNSK